MKRKHIPNNSAKPINVSIAGVTGWVGRELAAAIIDDPRFRLVGAVARKTAGQSLNNALGIKSDLIIKPSVVEVLNDSDVLVDYTSPVAVKDHVLTALKADTAVVIGTSGLSESQLGEISQLAESRKVGVFTTGNFALTAALLQKCAKMIVKHVPQYEIIDYAPGHKPDAPSSTGRELAYQLSKIHPSEIEISIDETHGVKECRGGLVNGCPIHSVRLPSFHFAFEVIFGASNERMVLRHEAGSSSLPYVGGTLLAIEKVISYSGMKRGLEAILEF